MASSFSKTMGLPLEARQYQHPCNRTLREKFLEGRTHSYFVRKVMSLTWFLTNTSVTRNTWFSNERFLGHHTFDTSH